MQSGNSDPLWHERVVSREVARETVGLSPATWDRIEKDGQGPQRIQLTERRIGYRVRDLLAWIEARVVNPA